MRDKPRQRVKVLTSREAARQEFRTCDAPRCHNVISMEDKQGYLGPVYCMLHSSLRTKDHEEGGFGDF